MVLVKRFKTFPFSYFSQNRPGKYISRSSETMKRLFRPQKQEVKKFDKLEFFHWG